MGKWKVLIWKEYGGEYEKLMINRINQYCITPIVPIYFNDMEYMLPELTASTWCNELTHYEGENLRGNVDADNRFEYCFGYNYRYIVIYDKKMRYLIHFKIPQYGENRSETLSYQLCRQYNVLSFMGMHIEDNIDITGNFFRDCLYGYSLRGGKRCDRCVKDETYLRSQKDRLSSLLWMLSHMQKSDICDL